MLISDGGVITCYCSSQTEEPQSYLAMKFDLISEKYVYLDNKASSPLLFDEH